MLLKIIICVLWSLSLTGLAWYCIHMGRQITYVTLADGRQQERKIPISFRLLLPLVPNVERVVGHDSFKAAREAADRKLTAAGFEGLLKGKEFVAMKLIMPLLFGLPWFGFVRLSAQAAPVLGQAVIPLGIAGVAWFYLFPLLWLRREMARRHRAIQRALPFVLDLLTLGVEAGLDFMTALQRNVERRSIDALSEELIRVIREIQLGSPRRIALRAMSVRVGLPELKSVVHALVQADELGVSIGSILRIQADQIRQRRFERAEKLANEAPVKLLGPLMMFIFPAVFLVLLGPIIYQMMSQML